MASGLQCMSNIPALTEYFLSKKYYSEINDENPIGTKGKLAEEYARLLNMLWNGQESSVRPQSFKMTIGRWNSRFIGYSQQDSHEFLGALIDGIHEDLNRIKHKPYVEGKDANGRPDEEVSKEAWEGHKQRNDSVIVENFHGQFKSTVKCPTCNFVSVTFDPFIDLALPVTKTASQSSLFSGLSKLGGKAIFGGLAKKLTGNSDKDANLKDDDNQISVLFIPYDDETNKAYVSGDWIRECKLKMDKRTPRHKNIGDLKQELVDKLNSHVNSERKSRQESHNNFRDLESSDLILLTVLDGKINDHHNEEDKNIKIDDLPNTIDCKGMSGLVAYLKKSWKRPFKNDDKRINNVDENAQEYIIPVCFSHEKRIRAASGLFQGSGAEDDAPVELVSFPVLLFIKQKSIYYKDLRHAIDLQIFPRMKTAEAISHNYNTPQNIQFDLSSSISMNEITNENVKVIEEQNDSPIDVDTYKDDCIISEFNTSSAEAYSKAMKFVISNGSAKNSKNKRLSTIQHCIEYFLQEEKLDEEDAWYCSKCKEHKQATKKFDIYRLPPILLVQLKRFGSARSPYSRGRKVKDLIKFPLDDLNMSSYLLGPSDKKAPPMYTLTGVSNHSGEMGFGHYTAYCKSIRDNKWYCYDDSSVRPANPDNVCSAHGYVLVYQRQDVWNSWRQKAKDSLEADPN